MNPGFGFYFSSALGNGKIYSKLTYKLRSIAVVVAVSKLCVY